MIPLDISCGCVTLDSRRYSLNVLNAEYAMEPDVAPPNTFHDQTLQEEDDEANRVDKVPPDQDSATHVTVPIQGVPKRMLNF